MERKPITRVAGHWTLDETLDFGGVAVQLFRRDVWDGQLRALVGDEPQGWHMSISHVDQKGRPRRYPHWDEIASAREELLPDDVTFAMLLPPSAEYVALHDTTFHLHQTPDRQTQALLDTVRERVKALAEQAAAEIYVGPEQPEMRWHYGPTADNSEPGNMWHTGCGGQVWAFKEGMSCDKCGQTQDYPA